MISDTAHFLGSGHTYADLHVYVYHLVAKQKQ